MLDGSQAGNAPGIAIDSSSNQTIRGLVISNFAQAGVQFFTFNNTPGPNNNTIAACYIGTDVAGAAALGNGWQGIAMNGSGNVIGGSNAADRNVISGNAVSATGTGGTRELE